MSRPLLILVIVLVAIIAAMVWLANVNTEVPPQPVRKPMLTEAQAK